MQKTDDPLRAVALAKARAAQGGTPARAGASRPVIKSISIGGKVFEALPGEAGEFSNVRHSQPGPRAKPLVR